MASRDYTGVSREDLERRLNAAEDVCAMFGWTAIHQETDREKALHELWLAWQETGGSADPGDNPHLTDDLIAHLAARRDRSRQATLYRLTGRN